MSQAFGLPEACALRCVTLHGPEQTPADEEGQPVPSLGTPSTQVLWEGELVGPSCAD